MIRYGSVCSGIEAVSLAWEPIGLKPVWFAEIDPFCNAILDARWPAVPNLGDINNNDFNERASEQGTIDILVGGTPCQAFSFAGKRRGLRDYRSNLALRFLTIAESLKPQWLVWDVGVLGSDGGKDFGSFLGTMEDIGYQWAYRVLDSRFFGIPQRRRRVYVVGHLGNSAGRVLDICQPETSDPRQSETEKFCTPPNSENLPYWLKRIHYYVTPRIIRRSYSCNEIGIKVDPYIDSLSLDGPGAVIVELANGETVGWKLTPIECERFPDNYTLVLYKNKPATSTLRYKAIGNSMAIPVMQWIGNRLLETKMT